MGSNIENCAIQLDRKNMVSSYLPNKSMLVTLIDSGASKSVISHAAIANNNYLHSIIPERCKPVKFIVGNGECMQSQHVITFRLEIQGNIFNLTSHVVTTLGGMDLIIGSKSLKELQASLDFETNKLRFKSKSIPVKLVKDITLSPGEKRIVAIKAKLPQVVKNAEMYFQATKFMKQYTAPLSLVKII